jgi:hypothetical protein
LIADERLVDSVTNDIVNYFNNQSNIDFSTWDSRLYSGKDIIPLVNITWLDVVDGKLTLVDANQKLMMFLKESYKGISPA